jgi:ADP-ribose pyrophosphatase YjhB (NUDIX family)
MTKIPPVATAACVLFVDGERCLLTARRHPPAAGLWCLPGGLVEPGETPEMAARREAREEVGLVPDALHLIGIYADRAPDTVVVAYLARAGDATPVPGDEVAALAWVAPGDGSAWPPLAFESTRRILADWLASRPAPAPAATEAERPIACVDLDGVVADVSGGYRGEFEVGAPLPGAREGLATLQAAGFRVVIYTSRRQVHLVESYLRRHDLPFDAVNRAGPDAAPSAKLRAELYIDDRAIPFAGSWPDAVEAALRFRPWQSQIPPGTAEVRS